MSTLGYNRVIFSWTITPNQVILVENQQEYKIKETHTLIHSLSQSVYVVLGLGFLSRAKPNSTQYPQAISPKP